MINNFANDSARISVKWLLRLINGRGLKVKHLLEVMHMGTGTSHHLAILGDECYVCYCCMGSNLGVPCRHYFQVLMKVQGMKFNIGLVRTRYGPYGFKSNYLNNFHYIYVCTDGFKIPMLIYLQLFLFLSS